jgi:CysZ protein
MLQAAIDAARQTFTQPFRSVLWKVLGLTLLLLALAWVGLDKVIIGYVAVPYPWLAMALSILTGIGLFLGLAFLVAPVSSLVAGFFLDELAELVERDISPDHVGKALPVGQALRVSAVFAAISIGVNIVALLLLLVPGVNVVAFLVANAYLLGREYFELAALRYRPLEEVRALRREHGLYLFVCGLFIAAFVAIPILNLLTPLFGTAFMVRIHARLERKRALN